MDEKIKFKIKAYIFYIILEPWVSKFHIPNLRVLNWVAIIVSVLILKSGILFSIFVAVGIFLHFYGEWKDGRFVYWYRMRRPHYRKFRETIGKIREERRLNKEQKGLNTS